MARTFVASALNSAGTATPSYYKDVTFTGCASGDLLVVGAFASGCNTGGTARAIATNSGSTGSWTTTSTSPTAANVDSIMGWATVSASGDVTVRANVRMPAGEYMNVCGWRIPASEWDSGVTPVFTSATADTNDAISVAVGQSNSLVLVGMADYNGVNPGTTNTPSGGTNDASYSGTFYATAWRSWYNQSTGTRDYGASGPSGTVSGVIACVVAQNAAYPEPISLRAAGTATSATAAVTAVDPAVPSGATTGDLSVLTVWAKPYSTTITTPSGWTKVGEQTNGTTASGTDTGSTKVAVYVLESASVGAIGNISQSGADSMGAVINVYAKDASKSWDYSSYTDGGDSSNGANYSATGAAGISVAADDWVLQSTAVNGDVGTQSAQAIGGMSGATLGTYAVRQSADVTTGNDSHGEVGDVPVTAGSSNAAPTFTYTNASSGSGTTIWLRLRQVSAGGATVTPAVVAAVGAVPSATVQAGSTVSPSAVAAVAVAPAPTVRLGAAIAPSVVAAVAAIGDPVESAGSTVTPSAVAATVSAPAPTVSGQTNATVTPDAVAATATIPASTVSGSGSVTASTVAAVAGVGSPTLGTGSTVTPSAVAAVAAVGSAAVQTGSNATAAPAVVAAVAAVGSATLGTGSTVTPSTVAAVGAVPAPTVSAGGNASVSASTVAAVAAVPAATLGAGATVSAGVVAGVASVGSATASGGATVAPATVAGVGSVGSPTVSGQSSATVTPSVVAAVAAIPAPSVGAGSSATVTPTRVAAVAAIPAPAVSGGAGVAPATVAALAAMGAPTVRVGSTLAAVRVTAVAAVPGGTVVFIQRGRATTGTLAAPRATAGASSGPRATSGTNAISRATGGSL